MATFDIETYLNSLPEDILEIDISYKNITYIPSSIIRFHNLQTLDCGDNQLTCLPVLPESLLFLFCYNNQLTNLPVLPESLQELYCDDNQLTCLPLLPESLLTLDCHNNPIYNILNKNNLIFNLNMNNLILNMNILSIIKYKIKVLNKFRYLYYCARLKKKFIGCYLWSKRKNYLMFSEGTYTENTKDYTHNYILNEYVGRDIMSYI
jgi:Leucine-rich repeat (LRR) protein